MLWKKEQDWKYSELAEELKMSPSEVHGAISRAKICDLYDPLTKKPKRNSLLEFLLYGVRYAFPAVKGEYCKGVPTAHSAKVLRNYIVSNENDKFVWPYEKGKARGIRVNPLYRSVPEAVKNSPDLYDILALIDALRVGKAREREIAKKELSKRIGTA